MIKKLLRLNKILLIIIFFLIAGILPAVAKDDLPDYLATLTPPDRRNGIISPSASVTIVTFEDYQCEACAHAHKILKQLRNLYTGRLNFIFRHYPLVDQHPNALKAAVAVEAAAAQGKFIEMHDKLLENQPEWINSPDANADFERYGRLFGPLPDPFDIPDTFARDFEEIMKRINQDEADAKKLEVEGVPTTFVNGRNLGYVTDLETISKEIEKDILPLSITIKFSPENTGIKTPTLTVTGNDVATKLPIKIVYESEGVTKEQTTPNDPNTVCQDASSCSIPVQTDFTVTNTGDETSGTINLPGDPSNWKITAYDPSGQEIAIYNGGIGSADSLWYWKTMEEFRKQEEENPFNPNNPQFIFFIILLILAILAWWKFRRR